MLCANTMPRSNDSAPKQRKRRLDRVGVNVAIHVNMVTMHDLLMLLLLYSGLFKRPRVQRRLHASATIMTHRLVCAIVEPDYERASSRRAEAEFNRFGTPTGPMKKDSARRA